MKASILVIVILFAIICSCDRSVDNHEWILEKMYTNEAELPQTGSVGEAIIFTVKSYLTDSCRKFSHLEIAPSGFDIFITPYMKHSTEELVCLAVVTGIAEDGQFTPGQPGQYTFHFWRSDTLSLDYAVTVQ